MKNKLIIIAMTSLCMMSCSKDFIRINPISTVSIDVLYKTDKDFSDALVGVTQYTRMNMVISGNTVMCEEMIRRAGWSVTCQFQIWINLS